MRGILTPSVDPLPLLTADLPGVGGAIKRYNEDFIVEEIPLYQPSGAGTHVYFTIEKQGLTTSAAVQLIARALGRPARDIGYSGLKDAHGVTQQTLSLEHIDLDRIRGLQLPRIRVLKVDRHGNKLKLGHLTGNRFCIRVRDAAREAEMSARPILAVLGRRGVPNYFGPQRFGARGDNAQVGLALVRGDYQEAVSLMLGRPDENDHGPVRRARELFDLGEIDQAASTWPTGVFSQQKRLCRALIQAKGNYARAWRAIDPSLQKLLVSALQSDLFNQVLAQRIDALDRVENGDLAWKHANGACFRVEDAAVEQPRCDAFEISATGPLFGRRMTETQGPPGTLESEVLGSTGLSKEQIDLRGGGKISGGRRPLRIPLGEWSCTVGEDPHGPFLQLSFQLPAGAYATSVLREVCKTRDAAADERNVV